MYLEKLEIQGFKSFAAKNKLVFPGMINGAKRGLTAVVGPNGSGKSNIADAVRWVLGEQSLKTLRGKKSEDVIFSGSDQKHQLSMAEVSLYLNNEDRSFKFRLDNDGSEADNAVNSYVNYQEIIITRRLFRNGDSEYLINNNRVRLLDIQLLLAKANFGQKTYSVIGQGMVENFLNTSAAERKDFFDEATGVKQFQIKRDHSLNKLEASFENLQQADMLLNEINPRLKSLTRQVEKLKKRDQLETELKAQQLDYYHYLWQEINNGLNKNNAAMLLLEKTERDQNAKVSKLLEELNKIKNADKNQETEPLRRELERVQQEKNQYVSQLARLQAEIELGLESQGKFDLAWLNKKQLELKLEIDGLAKEEINASAALNLEAISSRQAEKNDIDRKIQDLNLELKKLSSELKNTVPAPQDKEIKKIADELLIELEAISKESDLEKIKEAINSLRDRLNIQLNGIKHDDKSQNFQKIQNIQTEIIALSENRQSLAEEIGELRLKNSRQEERLSAIKDKRRQLNSDLSEVEAKINKNQNQVSLPQITQEKSQLETKLGQINEHVGQLTEKLNKINYGQEEEKRRLFELQRSLQNAQTENNLTQTEISELKIASARQETRLEDLENNIRAENLSIIEIKNHALKITDFQGDMARQKISSLKNQLEQIGGIDPETEKEYTETKERFDFLNTQVNDLKEAINSLEKIIYELDLTIKERFDKEFKVIEEKFNEYFRILFNGGSAKISKLSVSDQEREDSKNADGSLKPVENEELKKIKMLKKYNATGLAGIDLQATPPGKKIQSVTMLSGGERALTAIALISAIISANPSPFVVLDEVDAALDESNSERLARILDDLSNKTQFIVITHNRASMKKASVLYGITMHEGVSQLLSLKLEDYKKE